MQAPKAALFAEIAAERMLAGMLLAALRQRWPALEAHGIGGPRMAAQGFEVSVFAVNIVTNKVYIACFGDNTVNVLDGATNDTTAVPVGTGPVVSPEVAVSAPAALTETSAQAAT